MLMLLERMTRRTIFQKRFVSTILPFVSSSSSIVYAFVVAKWSCPRGLEMPAIDGLSPYKLGKDVSFSTAVCFVVKQSMLAG